MKTFNIAAARRGEPVVTQEGVKAFYIRDTSKGDLLFEINCQLYVFDSSDGSCLQINLGESQDSDSINLFMYTEQQTLLIQVYRNTATGELVVCSDARVDDDLVLLERIVRKYDKV